MYTSRTLQTRLESDQSIRIKLNHISTQCTEPEEQNTGVVLLVEPLPSQCHLLVQNVPDENQPDEQGDFQSYDGSIPQDDAIHTLQTINYIKLGTSMTKGKFQTILLTTAEETTMKPWMFLTAELPVDMSMTTFEMTVQVTERTKKFTGFVCWTVKTKPLPSHIFITRHTRVRRTNIF